jgi:TPR repeat protein
MKRTTPQMTDSFKDRVRELTSRIRRGDFTSAFRLAKLYLESTDNFDEKTALKWFTKSADMGCSAAYLEMAKLYQNGKEIKKNHKKTFTYMLKAGQNYDLKAFYELYLLFSEGKGTAKDPDAAFSWLYRAAETGDTRAYLPLAIALNSLKGTPSETQKQTAFQWMEKALAVGDEEAAYHLANMCLSGQGSDKDEARALTLLQRAASSQISEAYLPLGKLYLARADKDKAYLIKAARMFKKAAKLGSTEAFYHLALVNTSRFAAKTPEFHGDNKGEDRDEEAQKSVLWMKKAALGDFVPAFFELGNYYLQGYGTEKNLKKAHSWYQKAAKKRYRPAMLVLAKMYEEAIGRKRDMDKATKWRLAADATAEDEWKIIKK